MTDLERNLLIFTVYIVVVIYTLFQMILSLDREVTIEFDQDGLNQQLAANNLQDLISIQFRFARNFPLEQLRELAITIENKSTNYLVYVDWDGCSLSDFSGRSRRVTRLPPGMMLDLSQPQVLSVITPSSILRERITAEEVLQRTGDAGSLKISAPLFDIVRLKNGSPSDRQRYFEFATSKTTMQFSLQLLLRLVEASNDANSRSTRTLACNFAIKKQGWKETLLQNARKKPPSR